MSVSAGKTFQLHQETESNVSVFTVHYAVEVMHAPGVGMLKLSPGYKYKKWTLW